jgi:uncharacterized protein (TIGR01244 family)
MQRHLIGKPTRAALAIATLSLVVGLNGAPAHAAGSEVPFGDKVSSAIVNYNRTRPQIATSGLVREGGIGELKALGFTAIIDLRTPPEGTAAEKAAAAATGLRYFNIPVSKGTPRDDQVREFATLVEDVTNYPVLVHCASANRVGAMWTLYRVMKGIPFSIAVEEGRTVGMKLSRENAVRARLGQPPLAQ